jgi:hypothetical protein
MKNFIRKNITLIIFTFVGAAAGFLYWKFIGCLSGTCPIKSVWYLSTLYGSVLGYLTGSLVIELIARFRKKPAND